MLRHLAVVISLTGCRIASLPPASSRTDGGPVSARGVITHEARSQVRLYRDAAGCQSVQTFNRQFRLVTIPTEAGPERLVLEEAYDVRHCLGSGSASSEATITAWHPDSLPAARPAFRITGRWAEGTPVGNLYRLVSAGCCGSATLGTYFSLVTGRRLFESSLRPLQLGAGTGRAIRFIAFHDTFSAAPPAEGSDPAVVGVLQMGDDQDTARRLVLVASRPEPFALQRLEFRRNGAPVADSVLPLSDSTRALAVAATIEAPGSGRRATIVVPIQGDSLVVATAVLPAGFRFRAPR